jgi:hypothetical protein
MPAFPTRARIVIDVPSYRLSATGGGSGRQADVRCHRDRLAQPAMPMTEVKGTLREVALRLAEGGSTRVTAERIAWLFGGDSRAGAPAAADSRLSGDAVIAPVAVRVTREPVPLAAAADRVRAARSQGEGWARRRAAVVWSGRAWPDAGPPLFAAWRADAFTSCRLRRIPGEGAARVRTFTERPPGAGDTPQPGEIRPCARGARRWPMPPRPGSRGSTITSIGAPSRRRTRKPRSATATVSGVA